MAHPYHHALSSVKQWGGQVDDYLAIHNWFDESKATFGIVHCGTMPREYSSAKDCSE
jgi:hypothetical protein